MIKLYTNVVGRVFNKWTVIEDVGTDKFHTRIMKCQCICGTVKTVRLTYLTNGNSKSCGCNRKTSNGMYGTAEYQSWQAMIQRCFNPNNSAYKHYGGRGITVCTRWRIFNNFYEDMGARPKAKSLDRIDNNGNYTPQNCRWATSAQQVFNRR